MKKLRWSSVFHLMALAAAALFLVELVRGYFTYNTHLNSAPFSVWVLGYCVFYLLPAVIFFVVGQILKQKNR